MNTIVKRIFQGILIIAFLNIFAFSVRHVTKGYSSFGFLTTPIKTFSNFPLLALDVLREFIKPSGLVNTTSDFQIVNKLDYDIYAINSNFENSKWVIKLRNLKNDSILYRW